MQRCSVALWIFAHDDETVTVPAQFNAESDAESILSVRLLTFKNINGLVEQISQLRSLALDLSQQIEKKEVELKEEYEMKKQSSDTASKVDAVLLKAEEQGQMIESLHASVLANFREEIEKLRGEAQCSKDHMLQYKSIAQVNEAALKQMELAYENFKTEANDVRKSLEADLLSLKEQVKELENECKLKTEDAISASAGKEEALACALFEISSLKEDCSVKMSQILLMKSEFSTLKEDLEQEHQGWHSAQANYEDRCIIGIEGMLKDFLCLLIYTDFGGYVVSDLVELFTFVVGAYTASDIVNGVIVNLWWVLIEFS